MSPLWEGVYRAPAEKILDAVGVPGSKYYLCDWCPARYLTVYGQSIRLLPQDK